eukprot:1245432-Pyramimonas_sp.AAC.1
MATKSEHGDAGHPCRIPESCGYKSDVWPSCSTLNLGYRCNDLITFSNIAGTRILCNAENKHFA